MHRRVIVGGTVARSSTIDRPPFAFMKLAQLGRLSLQSQLSLQRHKTCSVLAGMDDASRMPMMGPHVLLVERVVCSREHCRAYYCSAAYGQVENCCERAPSCLLTRHVWLLLTIDRANAAATLSLARPVIYLYLGSLSLIVAWVMSIDSSTCWCHHRSSFRVDTSYAATEQRK